MKFEILISLIASILLAIGCVVFSNQLERIINITPEKLKICIGVLLVVFVIGYFFNPYILMKGKIFISFFSFLYSVILVAVLIIYRVFIVEKYLSYDERLALFIYWSLFVLAQGILYPIIASYFFKRYIQPEMKKRFVSVEEG